MEKLSVVINNGQIIDILPTDVFILYSIIKIEMYATIST